MYAEHQPQIAAYAARGPTELANCCRFVLATIQTAFPDAIAAYRAYNQSGERRPIAFFGAKHAGLDWLDINKVDLWWGLKAARNDPDQLVNLFAYIPCIGLVKAGFLAQLTHGVSGCIDTHNLQRFGMAYGDVRFNKSAALKYRMRRVHHYNSIVDQLGGTELLWNEWCEYVGKFQGYGSAEQVSAMHLQIIV